MWISQKQLACAKKKIILIPSILKLGVQFFIDENVGLEIFCKTYLFIGKTKYFQTREQWRITDLLFNPMVMMMVLPLFFIMILPKMMNDPDTKKEMEQIQNMTKFELPEMSDMVSNYLAGSSQPEKNDKSQIVNKKGQKLRKRIDK